MLKKLKNILCILTLAFNFIHAQEMPLNFSDINETFIGFLGSGFSINTDPENQSNQVGQFFNDGTNTWQGFSLELF